MSVAPVLALYDHDGFSQATLRERLPALNAHAEDFTWSDLCAAGWRSGERWLFVRPTHDLKSFPGRVIDADAYDPEALYARFEAQGNAIAMSDLVTVAPAIDIVSEHRFVVVGWQVMFA